MPSTFLWIVSTFLTLASVAARADIRIEAIDRGQNVINAAYALIVLGGFILGRMFLQEQETRAAQENLADLRDRKASNGLVKITRPFFTQYVVPIIRGKPFWDKQRKKFKRKLIAAGLRDELTPDEFVSFKLFLIIFFPLVLGILRAGGLLDADWYYFVVTAAGGWF